jgi:hypothetical protein
MLHIICVTEMGRGLYPTLRKISKPNYAAEVANIVLYLARSAL